MGFILTGDQVRRRDKKLSEFFRQIAQEEYPYDPEKMIKALQAIVEGRFEAINSTYFPTTSQKRAREIMGRNYFGVEEAVKHFAVSPTRQQLAVLSEIPFTEATLNECQDTHVLVAVFPLSVLEIRGRVESKLFYRHDGAWYNSQVFAMANGEVSWHLVRKTPVQNSTSKSWSEQQALLTQDEATPPARVMSYMIIGHYLAMGERLFRSLYVRCSDVDSNGFRVYVGYFGGSGLGVDGGWGVGRRSNLGLASSRKSN